MGSAVDAENLTCELKRYHDAGLGGVHIIPIYGAKGYENRYIEYLSPKWMEMLQHVMTETERFGMGADMTLGTGWCFGGPNITSENADAIVTSKTFDLAEGETLKERFDANSTQALVAFSKDREEVDLVKHLDDRGYVDWKAPAGKWQVYAISQKPGMKVKRAAPGGEGFMLNPFYDESLRSYLPRFSDSFAEYRGSRPRAVYHDSFEYAGNWSPNFLAEFERRRGYRLQSEFPALFGAETDDRTARVKTDYRETLAELLLDDFLDPWIVWTHERNMLTINQAHGSPGNLLDLYGAVDIPETEMFRDQCDVLFSKLASSAAHVGGKKLTSSETGTWLKEHFNEKLGDLKSLMDKLFLAGINHVFYHGTCYSPDEAAWPGWLFYASSEINPRNSIWRDLPALNAYITRCQSILQFGKPDNDVLLYWPIYDAWHNPKGLSMNFSVHSGLFRTGEPFAKAAHLLDDHGYSFDYISDRQLNAAKAENGQVIVRGGTYRAIIVPTCDHIPLATFEHLLELAKNGATVIFQGRLPTDVPGWGKLEQRSTKYKKLLDSLRFTEETREKIRHAAIGAGRILTGDLKNALKLAGVTRETMADMEGMKYIRRKIENGRHYFIVNQGKQSVSAWIPLAIKAESVAIMDPMTGSVGIAAMRKNPTGGVEIHLQLEPDQSVYLRTFDELSVKGPVWTYWQPEGDPVQLEGEWKIDFIDGGPELPSSIRTNRLVSWTELGGEPMQRFAGTARYTIQFDAPADSGENWRIDLGDVCQSARVRLNGRDYGVLFTNPFRIDGAKLQPQNNVLEIEVTNLMANRIRDLDRRGVRWKNFYNANILNINYKPFDASQWPIAPSGLIGPVLLQNGKSSE